MEIDGKAASAAICGLVCLAGGCVPIPPPITGVEVFGSLRIPADTPRIAITWPSIASQITTPDYSRSSAAEYAATATANERGDPDGLILLLPAAVAISATKAALTSPGETATGEYASTLAAAAREIRIDELMVQAIAKTMRDYGLTVAEAEPMSAASEVLEGLDRQSATAKPNPAGGVFASSEPAIQVGLHSQILQPVEIDKHDHLREANPPLQLVLAVRIRRVVQGRTTDDGISVVYRSRAYILREWARDDAKLLRTELSVAAEEMHRAVTTRIAIVSKT